MSVSINSLHLSLIHICLDLYYNENLTLAEIAEYFHISRQAVHDAMRHGEEQLAGYEKALRMLSRKKQKAKAAEKLLTLLTVSYTHL